MKKCLIVLIAMMSLQLSSAAVDYLIEGHEIMSYNRWSADLNPTITSTVQPSNYVCVGDDISAVYDYAITHSSSKITTICWEYYNSVDCNVSSYNTLPTNTGIKGKVVLGGPEYFDCYYTTVQRYDLYESKPNCKEELTLKSDSGTAYLVYWKPSETPPDPAPDRETVRYAKSRGGMVCDGTYTLTLDGTKVKSGALSGINSVQNVKVGSAGQHKLKVDASISRCGAMLFEDTKTGTYVHPFFKLVSGTYPAPVSKEITFTAITGEVVPEATGSVALMGSGFFAFPDTLIENKTDTIELKLKIKNPSEQTKIYVYEINVAKDTSSTPVQIKSVEVVPDPKLKILYGDPQGVIMPGETKEFNITVKAFAPIGSADKDDHRFEITYKYKNYSKVVCGDGFDKSGKIYVPFTVIKGDEPSNPYDGLNLGVSVNVEPSTVDYNNFEEVNEKGISVYGTVSLVNTSTNGPVAFCNSKYPCPNVTLNDVQVCRIMQGSPPLYTPTVVCISNCISNKPAVYVTKADGKYNFTGLMLKDSCKVGVNDIADIRATVLAKLGPLQTPGEGITPVNTVIPPLECTALNYDVLEIVPGNEKYRFNADLQNTQFYEKIKYYYDCGTGAGYKTVDDTVFECEYAVDEENDYTRIAGFKVEYEDKAGTKYTTHCPSALVGLCQVYLG